MSFYNCVSWDAINIKYTVCAQVFIQKEPRAVIDLRNWVRLGPEYGENLHYWVNRSQTSSSQASRVFPSELLPPTCNITNPELTQTPQTQRFNSTQLTSAIRSPFYEPRVFPFVSDGETSEELIVRLLSESTEVREQLETQKAGAGFCRRAMTVPSHSGL